MLVASSQYNTVPSHVANTIQHGLVSSSLLSCSLVASSLVASSQYNTVSSHLVSSHLVSSHLVSSHLARRDRVVCIVSCSDYNTPTSRPCRIQQAQHVHVTSSDYNTYTSHLAITTRPLCLRVYISFAASSFFPPRSLHPPLFPPPPPLPFSSPRFQCEIFKLNIYGLDDLMT